MLGTKMIRMRHVLHPITAAGNLKQRLTNSYYKKQVERANAKLPRDHVDKCWCGSRLRAIKTNSDYAACLECGCYVNVRPPKPEILKEFYALDGYWRMRQKAEGTPPIEERGELYRKDGRLEYWLGLVRRYSPKPCDVVEVGCAPGILLAELSKEGYRCTGVEPHSSTAEWIRRTAQVNVIEGIFPELQIPKCELFVSFDVAEHTPTPLAFWKGITDALKPGGVAIIQTPIERSDYENPFKRRPDFLDSVQHLYLYTDKSVEKLTALAGLKLELIDDSIGSLGQIVVMRKPGR
jgi:SAM-dependent methyltransferase